MKTKLTSSVLTTKVCERRLKCKGAKQKLKRWEELVTSVEDGEVRGRGFIDYTKRIDMRFRMHNKTIALNDES